MLTRRHHELTYSLRYPGRALPDKGRMDCSKLEKGRRYTYEVSLMVATGESFKPISFAFVY